MRRMRIVLPILILGFILIVGLLLTNPSQAQQLSTTPQPLDTVETLVMPPVDVPALLLEDEVRAPKDFHHGLPSLSRWM